MAFSTQPRQKRNLPEFEAPSPKDIERVKIKTNSISETELTEIKTINHKFFKKMHSDYVYEINFPKSSKIKEIYGDSFKMLNLYSISFPPSLVTFMPESMEGCYFLDKINFMKNDSKEIFLKDICDNSFYDTQIKTIVIPDSIKEIGSFCFPKCLKEILFENGAPKLERIGNNTFDQTHIEIFQMPTIVYPFVQAKNVFYKCKQLNTIIFDHFKNNKSNENDDEESEKEERKKNKLKFKENFQKVEEDIEISQDLARSCLLSQANIKNLEVSVSNLNFFYFYNTPHLVSITISGNSDAKFTKKSGLVYTKDEKKLIIAERNIKNATISSKCEIITNYALNVKSLEKVSFEKNSELREISFLSFYESQIKSITIPDCVDLIDYGAFYRCTSLESSNIPRSMFFIDFFTFSFTKLAKITIPKNIIKIGYACFYKCTNLKIVLFENNSNLAEIDDFAFAFTSIEKIKIPKSVNRIGNCCFVDCKKLKDFSFELDSNISSIGSQCFIGTQIDESKLLHFLQTIDFSIKRKSTDLMYSEDETIYFMNPKLFSNITQIFITSNVEEIAAKAFINCPNLTKVKIIDISNSKLNKISEGAFCDCFSLVEFEIPKLVGIFSKNSFKNCSNYKAKISLHTESIIICKGAFENSGIVSLIAQSNKMRINKESFKNCQNLVEISAEVNKCILGKSAFENCSSLRKVHISQNVKSLKIGEKCFMNSAIKSFSFPCTIETIPNFCFKSCKNLTNVTINEFSKITSFGNESFYESAIDKITISCFTKEIGKNCFGKCYQLKEVTFSKDISACIINEDAFNMSGIEKIHIPNGIRRIKKSCFENCAKLTDVSFAEGSMIKKIDEKLFQSAGINSITLPESVKNIGISAFQNCQNLKNVTFLGKDVTVSTFAFEGCNQLQNVKCNSSLIIFPISESNSIQDSFFIQICQEQMDAEIIKAFITSNELSFVINEKYHFNKIFDYKIGSLALKTFYSKKQNIIQYGEIFEYQKGVYYSIGRKEAVFCDFLAKSIAIPKETEMIKSNAFTFSKLKIINFEANSQLQIIESSAFENLSIKEISIPNTVTRIENSAFYNCKYLKKVILTTESQLKSIGDHAFEKTAIETILFPQTLTFIGEYAFYKCIELKSVENYSKQIKFSFKSFSLSSIKKIKFPPESYFCDSSFRECSKLSQLSFLSDPVNVVFEANSFSFTSLQRINIDNVVVNDNAFCFCKDLKRVIFPGQNAKVSENAFNFSGIETYSMNLQTYTIYTINSNEIINKVLLSNVSQFNLNINLNEKIFYLNHKCFVVDGELVYADLIDNVELFKKPGNNFNGIKKNEILQVSSFVKKINFQMMSHIKMIQWSSKCIVEDLGPPGFFSYYNLIEITIPKLVRVISPHLFENCHFLKVVQFEQGSVLSEIGEFAFSNTAINEINLPPSVKIIKQSAFSHNPKLKKVLFEGEIIENDAFIHTGITEFKLSNNTKVIGSNAFNYCYNLTKFDIDIDQSSLTEIGPYAFAETSIEEINIPPNVKIIKKFAFSGCESLKKVNISSQSSLEIVEEYSFAGDLLLETVNIPTTISSLSSKAFINTQSLKSIMNESNQYFFVMEDNSVYLYDRTLVFVPRNLKVFQVIPKCLVIRSGAFCGPNLESVIFSDESLLCIEESGFAHSTKLKEIAIPKAIQKIEDEAFIYCINLEIVYFDPSCNMLQIPQSCFAFSGLKTINLPNSIEAINSSSFYGCKKLKYVNLHQTNIRYIGFSAFSETSIETLKFPSSIELIENLAFEKTKSLNIVDFTECENMQKNDTIFYSIRKMKKKISRENKKIDDIIINQSILQSFASNEYQIVNGKVLFNLPKDKLAANRSKLVSKGSGPIIFKPGEQTQTSFLTLNNAVNIKSSSSQTFEVKTENKDTSAEKYKKKASKACSIKDSVFSNSSVKIFKFNLNEFVWFDFFDKCIKVSEYVVNPNIHLYLTKLSRETISCTNRDRLLGTLYKATKLDWHDQETIRLENSNNKIITPLHFLNASNLTKIDLGDNINVKKIPKCCFSYTALKEISIPASVETIEKSAFKYSYFLEKITFSKNSKLQKIDHFAFYECYNLKTILIPHSVDTIPMKCFSFSGLEMIKFTSSIRKVESMAFFSCKSLKQVILNEGIVEICSSSFENDNLLTSIDIPDSLKTIGMYAFANCSNLEKVNTSQNTKLAEINKGAFENTKIEKLMVSSEATIISEQKNIPNLNEISFAKEAPLHFIKCEDGTIYQKEGEISNLDKKLGFLLLPLLIYQSDEYDALYNKITSLLNEEKQNFLKLIFAPKNLESLHVHEKCSSISSSVLNEMNNLTTIEYMKGSVHINYDFQFWYFEADRMKEIKEYKIQKELNLFDRHSYRFKNFLSNLLTQIKNNKKQSDLIFLNHIPYQNNCNYITKSMNKIKTIKIQSDHIFLNNYAFKCFHSLETVDFGKSSNLYLIPKSAFESCENLKQIIIPYSCVLINEFAFKNCKNLKSLKFGGISKTTEVKNKLEIIEKEAFYGCESLVTVVIPPTISIIGSRAFMKCTKLKHAEIGIIMMSAANKPIIYAVSHEREKLDLIQSEAFRDCTSLVSFRVPQNCSKIEHCAFMNCTSLKTFTYKGNKLITIKPRTFYNCTSLTRFEISNLMYNTFNKELKHYGLYFKEGEEENEKDEKEDEIVLPFSIGSEAFMNCSSLKEVVISDKSKDMKLKQWDEYFIHFRKNAYYKNIIYDILKFFKQKIQTRAFCNCTSLEKARFFFADLDTTGGSAFMNCSSLKIIETNTRYWNSLISSNFNTTSFIGTPDNLQIKLLNMNEVVNSLNNIVRKQTNHSKIKIFKEHCSFLDKSLFDWPIKDDEKKKMKSTVINVFDGPRLSIYSRFREAKLEINPFNVSIYSSFGGPYFTMKSRTRWVFDVKSEDVTEYNYRVPQERPPLNI